MTETATRPKPLSPPERAKMAEMLERAGLVAVKPGQEAAAAAGTVRTRWQALTNISVAVRDPRTGQKTDKNHVVPKGEIVELDEYEAANLLRCGEGSGRTTPAIRKAEERGDPFPRLLPSQFSGPVHSPPPPPKGSDAPRPDPAGSSQVLQMLPPEATDTHIEGDEAADLPPSGRAYAAVTGAGSR